MEEKITPTVESRKRFDSVRGGTKGTFSWENLSMKEEDDEKVTVAIAELRQTCFFFFCNTLINLRRRGKNKIGAHFIPKTRAV